MIIRRLKTFSWERGDNGTWHYSPKGRELKFMYMKDKDLNEDSIEESEPTEETETVDSEESEREYSEKDDKKDLATSAAIITTGGVGIGLNKKLIKKASDNIRKDYYKNKAESDELLKKLINNNKKEVSVIKITKDPNHTQSSCYIPIKSNLERFKGTSKEKEALDKYNKVLQKASGLPLKVKNLDEAMKKKIILNTANKDGAAILAHELGHALGDNKVDQKFGKILYEPNRRNVKLRAVGTGGLGFAAGYKREKDKKEGTASKHDHLHTALLGGSALLAAPTLIKEGGASLRGLKLLKKAGASESYLKSSKKRLGNAFSTYAIGHSLPVISSEVGYQSGRIAGKLSGDDRK